MSTRILLNLSAQRVTLGLFSGGRLVQVASHAHDDAQAAFARLLASHPDRPVYMMLDVVEEDFRTEALPHVWGRARREMVARKLAQLFRAAPYRAACLQGRVGSRRRDDQYLFMALTAADLLRPYLDLVEARRAPLAGIWLLPVVSQALVERLSGRGNLLLVSLQGSGLRQSLFVDGWLRVSRLTPVEHARGGGLAGILAEEMENSRLFVYNARLIAREALLEAWVLDPDGSLAPACERIAPEPHFHCRVIGADSLARALDLPTDRPLPDMDALMLCLLGRKAPACSLAPREQTQGFAYHRWRRGLAVAAGLVLLGGLGVGAYNVLERQQHLEQARRLRAQAAQVQARYEAVTRSFPAAPASADHMRHAVEVVERLRALARQPKTAFRLVGRVMSAFPQVELSRVLWRAGETGANGEGFRPGPETLELAAEIRPFDGDYRAALALIGRLAQALRASPGVAEVRIARLPVNLDPKAPLTGNTADVPETAVARFDLTVVLGGAP